MTIQPPSPIRTDEAALQRVLTPLVQALDRLALATERTARATEALSRQTPRH